MKHLWVALVVLALSAFMPGNLSAQGVSPQSGRAQGAGLELGQNYPNPFNPVTTISYTIPKSGFIKIKVYDVTGKEIEILVEEFKNAGRYQVRFEGSNFASGIYFYKLTAGEFSETKRMVLIR